MRARVVEKIPVALLRRRMNRLAELGIHRAAESHVSVAQQIAPRDTGLMADTTHKEPQEARGLTTVVIAPQPYSGIVEFGSNAQPWFVPARESAVRQIRSEARILAQVVMAGGELPQALTITRSGPQRAAGLATRIVR